MQEIIQHLPYLELEELLKIKAALLVIIDSRKKQSELMKKLWITEDKDDSIS